MHSCSSRAIFPFLIVATLALSACADRSTPMEPARTPTGGRAALNTGDAITVTTTADVVAGSLRAAIAQTTGGEVIHFDPSIAGGEIVLDATLEIPKFVTIEGPQDKGIVISGGGKGTVLRIREGATLRNLTITGGKDGVVTGDDFVASGIGSTGPLTLDHSTVSGNETGFGAVVGNDVSLINSTIANNTGQDGAPGVIIVGSGSKPLLISNSTIAFNSGGVRAGEITFHNAIIAQNGVTRKFNCLTFAPGFTYLGRNIWDDDSCGGDALTRIVTDPKLLPLADNGGPTQTLALSSDSPAINATDCPDLPVDQRYVSRDARCDIGAFEFVFTTVSLTIDPNGAVDPKTGAATITGTMKCSRAEAFDLAVDVKQDQRLRRVSATVEGKATVRIGCDTTAKPWIASVTPPSGGFENTVTTVSVQTANTAIGVTPGAASSEVQLFWARR